MRKLGHHSGFRAFLVLLALGSAVAAMGASSDIRVHFKLTGGIGLLFDGAGDLGKFRQNSQAFAEEWLGGGYKTSSFEWPGRSSLPEWRAEVLVTFGPHFGIGFGSGQAALSNAGDYSLTFDYYDSRWFAIGIHEEWRFHHRFEVSMVPLELSAYGFLPLKGLTLYAFAGPGYYLGSLGHDYESRDVHRYDQYLFQPQGHSASETQNHEQRTETATSGVFGLRGGLGADIHLTPQFSVGFECAFRWVNFGDWQGSYTSSFDTIERLYDDSRGWWQTTLGGGTKNGQGSLWLYDILLNELGGTPGLLIQENPGSADFSNIRKAAFNFNGVSLFFSLTYHF